MSDESVPEEAIKLAVDVMLNVDANRQPGHPIGYTDLMARVLAAAAPVLRQAERERIRRLAIEHDAWISTVPWFTLGQDLEGNSIDYLRRFADLLDEGTGS